MTETGSALTPAQERLAIGSLALAAFVVAVNINLVGALMPFLVADPLYAALGEVGATKSAGSLLWTTSVAAAVASVLLGPMVDRVGRRGPMLVGGTLLVLAMAAHLVASSHLQLLCLRAASGFGGGLVFLAASAAVADLVPYGRRAAAMGVFSMGMFLALPLGPAIALWIASAGPESWRVAFGWLAVPGVLALVGFVRFLPAGLGRSDQIVSPAQVLRSPFVLPALLSVLLYTGAFFTAVQLAPSWLDRSGILAKERQAFLWIVLGVSTAAGSVVLPRLADRWGKRVVVLATSGGVGLCLVLLRRVDSLAGLWMVGIPLTLLAAARTPSLQALMSEIVASHQRGTLMGLRAVAVNVGNAAFFAAATSIYAERDYASVLLVCVGGVVAAYLLVSWFVRVKL